VGGVICVAVSIMYVTDVLLQFDYFFAVSIAAFLPTRSISVYYHCPRLNKYRPCYFPQRVGTCHLLGTVYHTQYILMLYTQENVERKLDEWNSFRRLRA